jgi:hypothetical protein
VAEIGPIRKRPHRRRNVSDYVPGQERRGFKVNRRSHAVPKATGVLSYAGSRSWQLASRGRVTGLAGKPWREIGDVGSLRRSVGRRVW